MQEKSTKAAPTGAQPTRDALRKSKRTMLRKRDMRRARANGWRPINARRIRGGQP